MKSKIFFFITILIIAISCKKPDEIITGNGSGSGSGTGGGGGNTNTNRPPIANAGPDQTTIILTQYTTAILNGNNSYDSSGMALQFSWKQISGPLNCFLQTPGMAECWVYNIATPGVYSFELKVSNSNGIDLDTTNITLENPTYCQSNRPEIPATLTYLSDLPGQIQNPEIIAAGNKLIMPAWFSNATGNIGNSIYIYDRVNQNWATIHTSVARIGAVTIVADNKVFIAGGVNGWDDDYTTTSVVDIYDLTTSTWSVTNLSEARSDCKAVVSGDKIFFAGGLKNNYILSNKVDIYDLETNTWSSSALPGGARAVGAALTAANKVLFCGGYTGYENPTGFGNILSAPSAAIDVYDCNTGQWSIDSMQVNKASFAGISVNEILYLAGGIVNNAGTFHVEELNANTMNSSGSCLHQPMICEIDKGVATKNDMIIFFTSPIISGIDINEFDIYNTQTGLWSIGVLSPGIIQTGSYTPIAIGSAGNEIYTVIGTKLYKMNL
jgi:hypothetical protein